MKYRTLLLLSLFCMSVPAFAAGNSADKPKKNLEGIKSQIVKQKASIKAATGNKMKVAAQLQKAQADLDSQRSLVARMNLQYVSLKNKQSLLEQKADTLTKKQAELVKTIRSANTYLASSGESEVLEAILLSDNVSKITAASQIIAQVNTKLYSSVTELKKNTDELNDTTKRLDQQKKDIAVSIKNKQQALKTYEAKKQSTADLYTKAVKDEQVRKAYMLLLEKQEKGLQAKIASIINAQKEMARKARLKELERQKELAKQKQMQKPKPTAKQPKEAPLAKQEQQRPQAQAQQPQPQPQPVPQNFVQYKGKLSWPVQGHIIERFGVKHVEGFSGVIMKKGIKIVPSSSTVRCVYEGTVIHIDNAWGLGNFIIVAHPSGFYTLYANLDGVNVKNGEKVRSGSSLGTIDVDRETNTPYLYFEIRLGDKAVDPMQWLAGS